MNLHESTEQIALILKTISQPTRLAILLVIGNGEACVCHLEAILGKRQAYISQHLMALRQAGVLLDRRSGRFVYYRIADPALLDLVRSAGRLVGVEDDAPVVATACACPNCAEQQPGDSVHAAKPLDASTVSYSITER
jgi:DNA-binding transcriptional ArsR family regulator